MKPVSFVLHDLSRFPLVSLIAPLDGMAEQWCAELQKLLNDGKPFVLLYPSPDGQEPDEGRAARGVWMERNRDRLREICRGLIIVEPDSDRRSAHDARLFPGMERAFGVPPFARPGVAEAEALARELLNRAST